jgi:hypothetical protein
VTDKVGPIKAKMVLASVYPCVFDSQVIKGCARRFKTDGSVDAIDPDHRRISIRIILCMPLQTDTVIML